MLSAPKTMNQKDRILKKIQNQENIPPTYRNRQLLLKLEEKGLVKRNLDDSYILTSYGETIVVDGFENFKKTEEFEKEIAKETTDVVFKRQMFLILSSTFLVLTLIGMLLLL